MKSRLFNAAAAFCMLCAAPVLCAAVYAFTDRGTMGGATSSDLGIDDAGQVAGNGATADNAKQLATLRTGITPADPGKLGGNANVGSAIDNAAQVAARSDTTDSTAQHAALWSGTTTTDLGTLGVTASVGNATNGAAQVAGYSPTRGAAERATPGAGTTKADTDTPSGTLRPGNAINDVGQVAGYGMTPVDIAAHATLSTGTTTTDLDILGNTGSSGYAIVESIGDLGDVVGIGDSVGNAAEHAFVWTGSTVPEVDSLLDTKTLAAGLALAEASEVNDAVTATKSIPGETRAFLLPTLAAAADIPEPGSMALAGLGVVVMAQARRRHARRPA